MSVINQVLNQLEQRGVQPGLEQVQVRAVPPSRRQSMLPWLLSGLVLVLALAVWQWLPLRQQSEAVPRALPVTSVLPPVLAASAVVTPPPATPESAPQDALVEVTGPALHLSFELSSIPLPAVARSGVVPAANTALPGDIVQPDKTAHPADQAIVLKSDNLKTPPRQVAQVNTPAKATAMPMKQVSPVQLADAEFAKAAAYMQQGRINEALAGYEATLRHYAAHDAARQALVALLLEGKRGADAERVLQEGLSRRPEQTGFAMLLARLQVERGAVEQAAATLEKSLPYADAQADFQAFFAALLQRQRRHKEAINHYQIALQLTPGNGVWLMGFGISLQAVQRNVDAKDAYQRALDLNTLSPNLQAFVQQKLRGL